MKLDVPAGRETLLTGQQLRQAATVTGAKRTVTDGGRRLLAVHTHGVVQFAAPPRLAEFNALVVHMKLVQPFSGSMVTRLEYSTRSPSLTENDARFSVLHFNQPRPWRGWQQVLIPAENLVPVGFPDAWNHVRSIAMDIHTREGGGEVVFGDIEVLKVHRPKGPRMTDAELLDALDLDRPDMRRVGRCAKAGRVDEAIAAFADVIRRTKRPGRNPDVYVPHYPTPEADAVCRHKIMNQQLPRQIDWHCNPIGYLEWSHAFNRHTWLGALANGFFAAKATKRRQYARKLDYFVRSWCEQNPEPIGHNGGLDPGWETLSTSVRINWAWQHILDVAAASDAISDRTVISLAKMIYAHAEHLLNYWGHCNWFISESTAILGASVMVPQFRRAEHWAQTAISRLAGEMRTQVFPDGVQYELSPGYHAMSAGLLHKAHRLASFGGYAFSAAYRSRLMKTFDFLARICRPDGTYPVPNDAGCALRGGNSRLREIARTEARDDWLWAGTRGRKGTAPAIGSVHFPDAGYAVMRSGWDTSDRWAFIDMAEFGAGHQHEDKLQVELYAHGTAYLIDPGISSYQHDPVVQHFRRSAAHNTIHIDGLGQMRKLTRDFTRYCSSSRGKNLWAAGRGLDFAQGTYDEAYGADEGHAYIASSRAKKPKVVNGFAHTRALVFVRDDYWLILDTVTGRGEHTVEAMWHFSPMHVRADRKARVFRTQRLTKPNIELICRGDWGRARLRVVTGQETPTVQGFAAIDNEVQPTPCAIAARKSRLPFHGATIAVPFTDGTDSKFAVTTETIDGARGTGMLITVDRADGTTDRFIWRHTGAGVLTTDGLRANGRLACVRTTADGAVTYAALMDGASLRGKGVSLKGKAGKLTEHESRIPS